MKDNEAAGATNLALQPDLDKQEGGYKFVSSLRFRLLLFVFLAMLPILGIMLYTAVENRQQEADKVREEVLTLTQLAVDNHEQLIEGGRQFLIGLTELSEIDQAASPECSQKLANLLEQSEGYTFLGVANLEGDMFCSGIPLAQPLNVSEQTWFQRTLETEDFVVDTYQIGRVSGKANLPLSYPVRNAADQIEAVVVAGLDLRLLNQLMAEARLPEMAALIVIDRNGTVLARYPDSEAWIGKTLFETPLVDIILRHGEGVVELPDFDDVTRLYAFSPLRNTGEKELFLGVGIPRQIAFAQVNKTWTRNLVGLGLVALLALLVAWWGSEMFVLRQVNTLIEATQALGHNLSARTGLPYQSGELGQLAWTFDKMAATLEEREIERQRTQEVLAGQAAMLRKQAHLLDLAHDAITMRNMSSNFIFWNHGAAVMYGWTKEEALGQTSHTLLQTEYPQPLEEIEAELLKEGHWEGELTHKKRNGTCIVVSSRWALSRNEQDEPVGILEINTDITELKRVEQRQHILAEMGSTLAKSLDYRDRLTSIARLAVPDTADWCAVDIIEESGAVQRLAVAHVDPEKVKLAERLYQRYPPDWNASVGLPKVLRSGQLEFYPTITEELLEATAQDAEHLALIRELGLKSAIIVPLVARGRTLGALTVAWGESNRHYDSADLDLAEEMARRAALAVDNARLYNEAQRLNTELEERVRQRTAELQAANTRLENEIDEHQRTQAEVLELQRRLMESIEAERLRLAQDLHDGPVQELYGVSYSLTGLKPELPTEDSLEQLAAMQAMLQNVIQTLRYTAGELRPPALAPFGLEKAIRSHIELFQERQPEVDVRLDLMPDGQKLSERTRLALYRVYQESLNNVSRHAEAQQVTVRLVLNREEVLLEIEDDGRGFVVPHRWITLAREGHLGLVGMQERMETLGGSFRIESEPGAGTLVRVVVPLQKEIDNDKDTGHSGR